MFQFAVMTAEGFTPLGSVSEFAEDRGHKAEDKSQDGELRAEKISNQQTAGNNYGKQPAEEKKHTAIKIVMLPRAPSFRYIPDVVNETRLKFAVGTFHAAISTNNIT